MACDEYDPMAFDACPDGDDAAFAYEAEDETGFAEVSDFWMSTQKSISDELKSSMAPARMPLLAVHAQHNMLLCCVQQTQHG